MYIFSVTNLISNHSTFGKVRCGTVRYGVVWWLRALCLVPHRADHRPASRFLLPPPSPHSRFPILSPNSVGVHVHVHVDVYISIDTHPPYWYRVYPWSLDIPVFPPVTLGLDPVTCVGYAGYAGYAVSPVTA